MEFAIFGEDVVDAADQNMKPDLQFQVDSGNISSSDKSLVYLGLKNRGAFEMIPVKIEVDRCIDISQLINDHQQQRGIAFG